MHIFFELGDGKLHCLFDAREMPILPVAAEKDSLTMTHRGRLEVAFGGKVLAMPSSPFVLPQVAPARLDQGFSVSKLAS